MMSPPIRWARMIRAAARETRNEPFAITSCWRSQSAVVVSASGLETDSPALFTTRSTPPKASAAAANARAMLASSVTSVVAAIAAPAGPMPPATAPAACPSRSATTTHAPSAARPRAGARPMADPLGAGPAEARPAAGHQRHPGGQRPGPGPAAQLGLLQLPVLDPELLALRDRAVGGDRLGAGHHVDRVDVELPGHPRGLRVRA